MTTQAPQQDATTLLISQYGIPQNPFLDAIAKKHPFSSQKQQKQIQYLQHLTLFSEQSLSIEGQTDLDAFIFSSIYLEKLQSSPSVKVVNLLLDALEDYHDFIAQLVKLFDVFPIGVDESLRAPDALTKCSQLLMQLPKRPYKTVLVVQKAEALSTEMLQTLMMMVQSPANQSNLRLVLAGGPAYANLINDWAVESENEATLYRNPIAPLSDLDVKHYFSHLLSIVGHQESLLFNANDYTKIQQLSQGSASLARQAAQSWLIQKSQKTRGRIGIFSSPLAVTAFGLSMVAISLIALVIMIPITPTRAPISTDVPLNEPFSHSEHERISSLSFTKKAENLESASHEERAPDSNKEPKNVTLYEISKEDTPVSNIQNSPSPEQEEHPTPENADQEPSASPNEAPTVTNRNPHHYTIQVFGDWTKEKASAFLKQHIGNEEPCFLVEMKREEQPWFVVLLGDFEEFQAAKAKITTLPEPLQRQRPWIRKYQGIQQQLEKTQHNQ